MKVTEDGTEMLKLCTILGDLQNHALTLKNLESLESDLGTTVCWVAEPSLGSVGTPGIAVGLQ